MIRRALIALALVLLTGCSAAGGTTRAAAASGGPERANAPARAAVEWPADDRRILRVLNALTYGPRPDDLARVRALGLEAFVEAQLHPERLDDAATDQALRGLTTLELSIPELLREYPKPDPDLRKKLASGQMSRREMLEQYPLEKRPARIVAELAAAKVVRAVSSERQLQEAMVDFWFNHFNVFSQKGDVRWYVTAYERDAIRPHALGKFRDLVRATARHPAMLFYLDNWLSAKPDFTIPAGPNKGKRAGLNENYARELMELHTLGVDGGYTQKDVTAVARAFTGWSIDRPQSEGRFIFRRFVHDTGEKAVLGQRVPAGGGAEDGERVIEILTRHPSASRFIATKLVRRFVADDPPGPLVERVAATYRTTDGDIRAMLRTIFTAPEFYAVDASNGKIKKPFEFVVSAVRVLDGSVDARGAFALARAVGEIGEPLYEAQAPTGYADRAEEWVNTGALLARMNFALGLAQHRFAGVRVDVGALVANADRRQPDAVLDRLLAALLHGPVSAETRAVLAAQVTNPQVTRSMADDRAPAEIDVEKLVALVIGSPEFQRR